MLSFGGIVVVGRLLFRFGAVVLVITVRIDFAVFERIAVLLETVLDHQWFDSFVVILERQSSVLTVVHGEDAATIVYGRVIGIRGRNLGGYGERVAEDAPASRMIGCDNHWSRWRKGRV